MGMRGLILLKTGGLEKQTAFLEIIKVLCKKRFFFDIIIANQNALYEDEDFYLGNPNINLKVLNTLETSSQKNEKKKKWKSIRVFLEGTKAFRAFKWCKYKIKKKRMNNDEEFPYYLLLSETMRDFRPERQYDYIWVCDETGLLWAEWLNQKMSWQFPVVYHCLELYWENYVPEEQIKWENYLEKELYHAAKGIIVKTNLIIIQDQDRWNVLCECTGIDKDKAHAFFPVSIEDYDVMSSHIIRDKFGIVEAGNIIFYPTLLAEKRKCLELICAAETLDDGYAVVLQGFIGEEKYVSKLKTHAQVPKSYISNEPLKYKDLLAIHRDIWCVFLYYEEDKKNDQYIVNASNKLAMALQAGKPIIAMGNKELALFCDKYMCGVVLKSWAGFREAVNKLESEYEMYCRNARECYKKCFDVDIYLEELCGKIENTARITANKGL